MSPSTRPARIRASLRTSPTRPARIRARGLLALAIGLGTIGATTAADARPASRGVYTEAGLGALGFLGPERDDAKIGPSLAMRIGYDVFSFLSIGINLGASSHEATTPPPPEGEWFQLYRGQADGRLGFRVNTIAVFVEGGAGAAYISSNVLGKVGTTEPGETYAFTFNAGGGIEYQIQNRHYAIGLAGDYFSVPQFDRLSGVEARAYLRYTY